MIFSTSSQAGDCMWFLRALRKFGGEHQFYCKDEYVDQLAPFVSDLGHAVLPLTKCDNYGTDVWVADGQYESKGCFYTGQVDIMGHVMTFMNHVGGTAGLPHPAFEQRSDMLWDAPVIGPPKIRQKIVDVLVVNSDPCSGQCPEYSRAELAELVTVPLTRRFPKVISVSDNDGVPVGYSLAEIGALSTMAKRIIMVATGPSWACWNVWARNAERILILDPQRIDYGPMDAPVHHAANAKQVRETCERIGWL